MPEMHLMKRREFVGILGSVALWPLVAHAQADRVRRIGLMGSTQAQPIERFRRKLRDLGYIEGKNLIVEYRYAEGKDELYPSFAAELAAMPVELIVVWGTPAAFAAKKATARIPIVLGTVGDVINTGLVSDLARPEGNITGFVALNADLEEKRLELLKEMLPGFAKVAVLGNRANPLNKVNYDTVRRGAAKLGVAVEVFEISNSGEVDAALASIGAAKPNAVIVAADTLLLGERQKIADAFLAQGIPSVCPFREYAAAGGLIVYGADIGDSFERSADYVHRILNGESPRNLPIQQATRFEIIINMKTAAKLGLSLPPTILTRANEVIE
jgi:putative tryptophan/tyrosine transport system substrate-binding protein